MIAINTPEKVFYINICYFFYPMVFELYGV